MAKFEAETAQARAEMIEAIGSASVRQCVEAFIDLLVLLRGVTLTNQEPGPAHTAAREVAESAIKAALGWLKE